MTDKERCMEWYLLYGERDVLFGERPDLYDYNDFLRKELLAYTTEDRGDYTLKLTPKALELIKS